MDSRLRGNDEEGSEGCNVLGDSGMTSSGGLE
jgi:hypothetical protein